MPSTRPSLKSLLLRLGVLLFWSGLILWLSLHPSPPSPPRFFAWDKLQHAGAYAVLTFFAGRLYILFFLGAWRGWVAALATAFLFGALVEIAQGTMTAGRFADPGDLAANILGAAGIAGPAIFYRLLQRSENGGRP